MNLNRIRTFLEDIKAELAAKLTQVDAALALFTDAHAVTKVTQFGALMAQLQEPEPATKPPKKPMTPKKKKRKLGPEKAALPMVSVPPMLRSAVEGLSGWDIILTVLERRGEMDEDRVAAYLKAFGVGAAYPRRTATTALIKMKARGFVRHTANGYAATGKGLKWRTRSMHWNHGRRVYVNATPMPKPVAQGKALLKTKPSKRQPKGFTMQRRDIWEAPLLRGLESAGDRGLTTHDVAKVFGIKEPAARARLRILVDERKVHFERSGSSKMPGRFYAKPPTLPLPDAQVTL